MNDTKDYRGPDGKAAQGAWKRIWTKPLMATDSQPLDIYSAKDFARVTNKGGQVGDLWQRSAELSAAREAKDGKDSIKQTFYDEYAKKRKGYRHSEEVREITKRKLDAAGLSISYGE